MSKPSLTNCPKLSPRACPFSCFLRASLTCQPLFQVAIVTGLHLFPIPNREVKPVRADGTASSGRVGSRRFFQKSPAFHTMWSAGFLICIICMIRMKAASGLCIGSPDKPRGLGIHPCRSERVGLYILWYI